MTKTREVCPNCGSKDVIPIVYGYPPEELGREAKEGKVHLGGCGIYESNPQNYCKKCETEW